MAQTDEKIWNQLFQAARSRLNHRVLSTFVEAGNVAAAIMTEQGNVYTGVCIDASSGLGTCAERVAVANMITCGEHRVTHLVCVRGKDILCPPCGACRDFLLQLDPNAEGIEVLIDREGNRSVKLGDLLPNWWGKGIHDLVENWYRPDCDDE